MSTHPLWRPHAPTANVLRQPHRVAHRQVQPGPLALDHTHWAAAYLALQGLIAGTIPDQIVAIRHVGSTAVPGLLAKPIIDIDLTVPAVDDERAYLPPLEAAGFRLIFRDEVGGDPHRQLTFGEPNANLHLWNPGAVEPQRHEVFTRWLTSHDQDRDRYAAAKLKAASSAAQRYNDAKSSVVHDIYEQAFLADPHHPHDPHPWPDSSSSP